MKIKKCCHCKSKKIIYAENEIYCSKCGLVLAATYPYDAGFKTYYPFGLIYGGKN